MIARFSAYGFLKNLRLFEAFLVLALRERGLSYADIGLLIAVREVVINCCEVPSGALADAFGRRRCMVGSMMAYLGSYALLGLGSDWWLLALGMVLYGVGDAFRSGTHKALIYTWLRQQGREHERTRVYGFTRSWSQLGSALSGILAGIALWAGSSYTLVFLLSLIPALINLLNLATYPGNLDPPAAPWRESWRDAKAHLRDSLHATLRPGPLRSLFGGTLAMEGTESVADHYLPVIIVACGLSLGLPWQDSTEAGWAVGTLAALISLGGAVASRKAHAFETRCGTAARSEVHLLALAVCCYVGLAVGTLVAPVLACASLVVIAVAQNIWRPIHIGRFDSAGAERHAATTLSLEAQAKALMTMLLAPLMGWLIDLQHHGSESTQAENLWPLALLGLVPLLVWLRQRHAGS